MVFRRVHSVNSLIGAHLKWANYRHAGRAYNFNSVIPSSHITLVTAGRAEYTIENNTYPLEAGKISLTSKNERLQIKSLGHKPFSFIVLNFDLFNIEGNNIGLSDLDFPHVLHSRQPQKIKSALLSILKVFRGSHENREIRLSSRIIHLLKTIQRQFAGEVLPNRAGIDRKRPQLERAVEFVYRNLGTKIRLADMAGAACLSPHYFNRYFKKVTGETPLAFVGRLKIERAKTVLLNSEQSISQVAAYFGFDSQAHFTRRFIQFSGMSPSEFLKRHTRF